MIFVPSLPWSAQLLFYRMASRFSKSVIIHYRNAFSFNMSIILYNTYNVNRFYMISRKNFWATGLVSQIRAVLPPPTFSLK